LTGTEIVGTNLFLTDLRGAVGLEKEKLQTALNWFFALYDEEVLKNFGLPVIHNELVNERDFRTFDFEGLDLTGADFRGANLRQARMNKTNLKRADFRDADLYAVNLGDANLNGADFKDAILLDADISGADLSDAVNLTMEQVRWAKFDSNTVFPDYLKEAAAQRLRKNIIIDTLPAVEPLDSLQPENQLPQLE
jgi:uncharacterized protein YjbI with pentapeptide repeats